MRRTHNVENSPDIGSVCRRGRKATDMTNTVGRAEWSSWVEGVIFKPNGAARKAGLTEAGLPRDSGTWLGLEQGRRGLAPTLHPQVLPGFSLLSLDHGSETTLAAQRARSPAHPSFKQPPFTPRIQDHSLGSSISHLTLMLPSHYLCPQDPEASPKA